MGITNENTAPDFVGVSDFRTVTFLGVSYLLLHYSFGVLLVY